MKYLGDIKEGQTIRGSFNTRATDGSLIGFANTPTLAVYKDVDTTESTAGVTLTINFDGRTGLHLFTIVTTDAFYTTGSDYIVFISSGITSDFISVVGVEVGSFSIENRSSTVAAAAILQQLAIIPHI